MRTTRCAHDHVIERAIEINRPYLCGGVADFVAQICDQEPKPLVERAFFEHALTP